jgi:putative ATPase
MRPRTLDEFVGQDRLLQPGSALRTAIDEGRPHSMILHGPPGSGKTTLARLVAEASNAAFEQQSAVQAGRAEVRAVIDRARERLSTTGTKTIFFLDEIHRFNKAQQDALLPAVEDGVITLIGATTENPYFEVNSALLSRTQVYVLEPLGASQIRTLLDRALQRGECGSATVDPEALDFLAERSAGDARTALNALDLACQAAREGQAGDSVTLAHAEDALQRRALLYDRQADYHYDTISAWIKATRGSDPDASLYYLAVMLEGGEDPRFIVRRMVVLASEDIGNADPQALAVATAVAQAVEHVGLPECQFALAQAAIYLSLAPKSDAAKRAIGAARGLIRERGADLPPGYLRSSTRSSGDYDNPHNRPGHISPQELMPESAIGRRLYEPDEA